MNRQYTVWKRIRHAARESARAAPAGVLALMFAAGPAVAAEQYPARPIRVIVMSGPGSGPDILSRLIGARLTETWGQQVVIDNRAGANGIIGAEIGARAAADGYTLLMVTSQAAIVSAITEKLPYDLLKDFAPIGLLGTTTFAMVVHPSVAANSVKELIALAKSKPGEIKYGSTGTGSPSHLATEILKTMAGIDLFHVPYKTVAPALTDTMAGQVHLTMQVVPSVLPFSKSGRLRVLGVTSANRSSLVPDWPAIAETVPGYEFMGWYGLVAPAKTPAAIVARLNAELMIALKLPEFRERLAGVGAEPAASTPEAFASHMQSEIAKLRKAASAAGIRAEM